MYDLNAEAPGLVDSCEFWRTAGARGFSKLARWQHSIWGIKLKLARWGGGRRTVEEVPVGTSYPAGREETSHSCNRNRGRGNTGPQNENRALRCWWWCAAREGDGAAQLGLPQGARMKPSCRCTRKHYCIECPLVCE